MDEIRVALRRLTARPAATSASVLTLACAIGAATATWSLLLHPLPVRDPDSEFRSGVAGACVRTTIGGALGPWRSCGIATGAVRSAPPPISLWLFRAVRAFRLPGRVDVELLELSIDGGALLAAGGGASVATLLIALTAGAFGVRADPADALRSRAGVTPRSTRRRTRAVLVAGQVAVAVVLTAGAGLFARSLGAPATAGR